MAKTVGGAGGGVGGVVAGEMIAGGVGLANPAANKLRNGSSQPLPPLSELGNARANVDVQHDNAAYSSSAAAASAPLLTYGKDGKIRPLKPANKGQRRPMPLPRGVAIGGAGGAPKASSAPSGIGASDLGFTPALGQAGRGGSARAGGARVGVHPPVGASPGELRLWKMQNGFAV